MCVIHIDRFISIYQGMSRNREFPLNKGHGFADYLLYVNGIGKKFIADKVSKEY